MYHSVRKPGYVYVYIAKAKLDYGIAVARVFSCVFPHPSAYDMFNADTAHYLNRLSYLVLGQC